MLDSYENQRQEFSQLTPQDIVNRLSYLRAFAISTARSFVDCARGFASFQMWKEAGEAYSEAIGRDGSYLEAFLGRAQIFSCRALLEDDEARREELLLQSIKDFRRVVQLTNGNSKEGKEAVLGIATGLLVMNRFAECSAWIEDQLRRENDKDHIGDLYYLFALCRLFSGDLEQAKEYAREMARVAGFDSEQMFIWALLSNCAGDQETFVEHRESVARRDSKLSNVLGEVQAVGCHTFLDLARLLMWCE